MIGAGAKNVHRVEPKPKPEFGVGFRSPDLWDKRVNLLGNEHGLQYVYIIFLVFLHIKASLTFSHMSHYPSNVSFRDTSSMLV